MPDPHVDPLPPLRPAVSDEELARRRREKATRRAVARWTKRGLLAIAAAGVAGLVAYGWIPKPVTVDVAAARRSTLRVLVEEDGRTRVRERYVVSAPVGGQL